MLKPSGHLLILFSNYAKCRGLVERSPLEKEAYEGLELRSVQRKVVEDRKRHRQTRRDKAWVPRKALGRSLNRDSEAFKEEHQVELWDFEKSECYWKLRVCDLGPYFRRRVVEAIKNVNVKEL